MTRLDALLDAEDRLAALFAHPRAAGFAPALRDLRGRLNKSKSRGVAAMKLLDDLETLERAMQGPRKPDPIGAHDYRPPLTFTSPEDRERREQYRARTREQLDGTVSAQDLDYLASRAGERRRKGQTYGQTEHMLKGAKR